VFFFLSKTLGVMLLPSNIMIGIGVVGLLFCCSRGSRRWAGNLLLSPCGYWQLRVFPAWNADAVSAESRFPPWDAK